MPYTNSKSTPSYVYRVDNRPPEVIFREGFTPWGTNNDFFRHILGHSLRRDLPEDQRSIFISASDSPDSAIRFFGSLQYNPGEAQQAYLYEIRADENVYSAARTASNFLARIRNRTLIFERGDYVVAREAIDSVFRDFAFQREWFNVGSIHPSRIRSAFRIDTVPINPDHIRHQRDTVYATPRINEPEIMNVNYVSDQTSANFLPYDPLSDILTPLTVTIPETIVETDTSGGVLSSMGFACNLDMSENVYANHRDKRSVETSPYGHCYPDRTILSKSLRNKYDVGPYIFSSVFYSLVYLQSSNSKEINYLGWENIDRKYCAVLVDLSKPNLASQFIYDNYQRISLRNSNDNICYCLTVGESNDVSKYEVNFKIASINDQSQKWEFECIDEEKDIFRIKSLSIKNFSIFRKTNDQLNKLYILESGKNHDGYEEVFLIIDKDKSDSCILLQQRASNQLIDLKLSWYHSKQFYSPIPETGFSKAMLTKEKKFFYDPRTYKIVYINDKHEIFCLYNKRYSNTSKWDWVRWMRSDLEETNDDRQKWYFQIQNWRNNFEDINFRNIRSFMNNDWLRVIVFGVNWGSFYTTYLEGDKNSLSVFAISSDANL